MAFRTQEKGSARNVAILLLAVALGALAWLVVDKWRSGAISAWIHPSIEAEDHALLYPRDETMAFAWVSLHEASSPRGAMMRAIGERLYETWAMRRWVGEADAVAAEALGLGISDFAQWAGPTVSAGIVQHGGGTGSVVTLQVRDQSAAAEFMDRWIGYWERETSTRFRKYRIGTGTVWTGDETDWMGSHSYALLDGVLIFGSDMASLDLVASRVDDAGGADTLADRPDFADALTAGPSRGFLTAFADERWLRAVRDDVPACLQGLWETPRWVSVSARTSADGIALEAFAPSPSLNYEASVVDPLAASGSVTAGSFGYLAFAGGPVDTLWEHALKDCPVGDGPDDLAEVEMVSLWPFEVATRPLRTPTADPSQTLAATAAHQRTMEHVPSPQVLLYLDVAVLLQHAIGPPDLAFHHSLYDPEDLYRLLTRTVAAVALSGTDQGGYRRVSAVMTMTDE